MVIFKEHLQLCAKVRTIFCLLAQPHYQAGHLVPSFTRVIGGEEGLEYDV